MVLDGGRKLYSVIAKNASSSTDGGSGGRLINDNHLSSDGRLIIVNHYYSW